MRTLATTIIFVTLSACGPMGDFYPTTSGGNDNYGYDDPYYDDGYRYDRDRYEYERRRREEERLRKERRDLDRERQDLEEERRRHEQERRRREEAERKRKDDNCPSGFRPGNSKCTDKQRKKGCQDTRAPSGRLCVRGI